MPLELLVPGLYLDWQLDRQVWNKSIEAKCYFSSSLHMSLMFPVLEALQNKKIIIKKVWQIARLSTLKDIRIRTLPVLIMPIKTEWNTELCLHGKSENYFKLSCFEASSFYPVCLMSANWWSCVEDGIIFDYDWFYTCFKNQCH